MAGCPVVIRSRGYCSATARKHRPADADALVVRQHDQPRDPPHAPAADGGEDGDEGDGLA